VKQTDFGFIGVGNMGGPMARRLLAAGHSLTVFDMSKAAMDELAKAGAQTAGSALEVANATETAFPSLPDTGHRRRSARVSRARTSSRSRATARSPAPKSRASRKPPRSNASSTPTPVSGGIGARATARPR
jgi:3-hydroxyisobutyrate dehydrogenase-like beta-hydroxyacid dehydrogenase